MNISRGLLPSLKKVNCPIRLHLNGTIPSPLAAALVVLEALSMNLTKWLKGGGAIPC